MTAENSADFVSTRFDDFDPEAIRKLASEMVPPLHPRKVMKFLQGPPFYQKGDTVMYHDEDEPTEATAPPTISVLSDDGEGNIIGKPR